MSSFPSNLPRDPSYPVLSGLSRACDKNWDAFFAIVLKASAISAESTEKSLSEADAVKMMENALSHLKNVVEVLRWIRYPRALPIREAFQKAQAMKELGDDWVEDMFSRLQKLPQGAPPKRRQSHIKTFEYMLQSKKNSLGRAVGKFCPCGKTHDSKCFQQLKSGIHSLRKVLRKYVPDIVAQYDALHPDRSKKSRAMVSKSSGFSPHSQ